VEIQALFSNIPKIYIQIMGEPTYVRLFDDRFTTAGDKPTIGLILCAAKNEAVARYSVLNESKRIFAAKYVKILPTEDELQRELLRERQLIETRRIAREKC
jgi:hypothetical protein